MTTRLIRPEEYQHHWCEKNRIRVEDLPKYLINSKYIYVREIYIQEDPIFYRLNISDLIRHEDYYLLTPDQSFKTIMPVSISYRVELLEKYEKCLDDLSEEGEMTIRIDTITPVSGEFTSAFVRYQVINKSDRDGIKKSYPPNALFNCLTDQDKENLITYFRNAIKGLI